MRRERSDRTYRRYPPRFSRWDYAIVAAAVVLGLLALAGVVAAFLGDT